VKLLAADTPLPRRSFDHSLSGEWYGGSGAVRPIFDVAAPWLHSGFLDFAEPGCRFKLRREHKAAEVGLGSLRHPVNIDGVLILYKHH
jgi:hypothetical protein